MIDYDGRNRPASDLRVRVRFRDGEETKGAETVGYWEHNWTWDRRFPSDSEIVAYEVIENEQT